MHARLLAPILAATACSGTPCQLDRLDDMPAAASGEVRHGLALAQNAGLSATATGVACLTCGGIYYFDAALTEQRYVALDLEGTGELAMGGDTSFVFDRDPGGAAGPAHYQLFALSATGRELWRDDLDTGAAWQGAVGPELLAGPGGPVIYGETVASAFDPATGAPRWTATIQRGDALAPDAAGGLFIATGASVLGPATPQVTLRHLAATGTADWTATWTTGAPPNGGGNVSFAAAAPTADGGLVVAGWFTTQTLELGDVHLAALPLNGAIDGTGFVAALDGTGEVRWAIAVGTSDGSGRISPRRIAALGDAAVLCGDRAGAGQLGLAATDATTDAFVARVAAGGDVTAHAIGGDGDQTCEALAVAADGSATVTIHSARGPGGSVLRVGSQSIDDGPEKTFYVLNLAP
ncbi:MAG TPA: hypothetical protein VHW23_11785 [Kofleriaceae bacterium]|nr:hypothetical protein [Kofleriaceae bacterium]